MKYKIFVILFLVSLTGGLHAQKSKGEYYQLIKYSYTSASQEAMLDAYLEEAYIPALHRNGVKNVGTFKAISNDTTESKTLLVLIPVTSFSAIETLNQKLATDKNINAHAYTNTAFTSPAFTRKEVIILKSFQLAPKLILPALKTPRAERVYEMRSYESASEKIFRNKVHMFNEGDEIGLFKKLNFNAIFYGEVLAGSRMPNLMYMTSFENKQDRDAHWKTFGSHPDWKQLSGKEEYKNNVSKIEITFLRPTEYSDF